MDAWADPDKKCDGIKAVRPGDKDTYVQLIISLALGLSAFIVFCVSRRTIIRTFCPGMAWNQG